MIKWTISNIHWNCKKYRLRRNNKNFCRNESKKNVFLANGNKYLSIHPSIHLSIYLSSYVYSTLISLLTSTLITSLVCHDNKCYIPTVRVYQEPSRIFCTNVHDYLVSPVTWNADVRGRNRFISLRMTNLMITGRTAFHLPLHHI
jgi:hypothetical protein